MDSGFYFGESINERGAFWWNPDGDSISNANMNISGESGSGKSHLLRSIAAYLALPNEERKGKHVYILDIHGDLKVDGVEENLIEMTGRGSIHGINPFEFDKDEKNGGSLAQIPTIVSMIKKAFLPSMGQRQDAVLRQLLTDCYRIKGISDEDTTTWDKELPSMETLLDLIQVLIRYFKNSGANINDLLQKLDKERRALATLDYAGHYFKYLDEWSQDQEHNFIKLLSTPHLLSELIDEAVASIESHYGEEQTRRIVSKVTSMNKIQKEILFLTDRFHLYCVTGMNSDMFGVELPSDISIANYDSRDTLRALEGLELYISAAKTSGVFSDKKPPIKPGLNRFDISGLTPELQSFFVDAFANRLYLTIKRRGEYQPGPRGRKNDMCIIIDEGVSILPSGKELNSNTQILNKWFQELRKFGAFMIFVSQSPTHYSSPILSAYTKVVLKLQSDVVKKSMGLLGIEDKTLFKIIEQPRTALVGQGSYFQPVKLPGYKEVHKTPSHPTSTIQNSPPKRYSLKGGAA